MSTNKQDHVSKDKNDTIKIDINQRIIYSGMTQCKCVFPEMFNKEIRESDINKLKAPKITDFSKHGSFFNKFYQRKFGFKKLVSTYR